MNRAGPNTAAPDYLHRALALCQEAVGNADLSYAAHERLFAELDDLLLCHDWLADALLQSPDYQALRVAFLQVRAVYEFERERVLAEAIVSAGDASPLHAFRSRESYDDAHAFEHRALAPYQPKHVLFVGSGPFPITAIAFKREYPDAAVTCVERCSEGCRLGAEVIRILGCEGVEIIHADGLEMTDFSSYDCVHVGTVVGVLEEEKQRVVEHFTSLVPASALLVFRTAVGPGRIIFPSVDLQTLGGIDFQLLPDPPQKTYSMILTDRSDGIL